MANDVDMWYDLEMLDQRTKEYKKLFACYNSRFIDFDKEEAEKLKEEFIGEFETWGNYY